jgi:membrane associated rhomboid family serine protease
MLTFMSASPTGGNEHPGARLRQALFWPLLGVGVLWLLAIHQAWSQTDWVPFGVLPRTVAGLPGILTAPLVHDSWSHLLANTPSLLGLGVLALYGYPRATRHAIPVIWLLSGLGVWLFARGSFHIGISGLTHGLLFYVVAMGLLRRDPLSIVLAIVVFLVFGSMASGILPGKTGISFEYHLFGAIAGVIAAVLLSRLDPRPPRPVREDPSETTDWTPPENDRM